MTRLVILDRDGVINQCRERYVPGPDEWEPIPGSLAAIASLCLAGFKVAVATNQSQIGRGLMEPEKLAAVHSLLEDQVRQLGGRIELILYCPHAPDAGCLCRKPAPGMLRQISQQLDMPLVGTAFVGDAETDLAAAAAAGCRPFLVRTGKGAKTEKNWGHIAEICFDDLAAVADYLIEHTA